MRLTCPNCDAQYEVPDEVIPPEGRDVQCSNCGDTWYQTSPNMTQPAAAETPAAEDPAPQPQPDPESAEQQPEAEPEQDIDLDEDEGQDFQSAPTEPSPAPSPEPSPAPEPDPAPQPEAEPEIEDDEPSEVPAHTGLARGMDPSVTGILREEAEREALLRAAESAVLENQPDLGLDRDPDDENSRRAGQARDRMARMKGENPALLAAAESGSRRGLLPDIEEINSTLRAGSDPVVAPSSPTEGQDPARRKSGFSRGFAIILLLVLGLVLVYANAPQIAASLPQADPYLSSYVAMVDQARLWLDTQASGFLPPQ